MFFKSLFGSNQVQERESAILSELGPFRILPCNIPINLVQSSSATLSTYRVKYGGRHLFGKISPKSPVNLGSDARQKAKIPENANFFVWAYPASGIASLSFNSLYLESPEEKFLTYGGFVYLLDESVVSVNAIDHSWGSDIVFSGPHMVTEDIPISKFLSQREPITEPLLLERNIRFFCWILPEEIDSKGQVIAKYGGFLYWQQTTKESMISYYFRVTDNVPINLPALSVIYVWEYLDKNYWCAFDPVTNLKLERSFTKSDKTLTIEIPSGRYTITFSDVRDATKIVEATQIKEDTRYERKLRRVPASATQNIHHWVYLKEPRSKEWIPYDVSSNVAMEKHYLNLLIGNENRELTLLITFNGVQTPYTINFNTMQQRNDRTNFQRSVRRQVQFGRQLAIATKTGSNQEVKKFLDRRMSFENLNPVLAEINTPCCGKVKILVKGATNLGNDATIDPYVFLSTDFSQISFVTPVISGNNSPQWNLEFSFRLDKEDQMGNIIFTFNNRNIIRKDQYLGRLSLPLFDVVKQGQIDEERELNYEFKGKLPGIPRAKFSFKIIFESEILTSSNSEPVVPIIVSLNNASMNRLASRLPTVRDALQKASATRQPTNKQRFEPESLITLSPSVNQTPLSPRIADSPTKIPTQQPQTPTIISQPTMQKTMSSAKLLTRQNTVSPVKDSPADVNLLIQRFDEIATDFTNSDVVEGVKGKYVMQETIGEGSYGIVRKAFLDSDPDKIVAVKIIPKTTSISKDKLDQIMEEITILHSVMDCKYCVSVIDSRQTLTGIYIVMEYCTYDLISAVNYLNYEENQVLKPIKDMCLGLEFLHSMGICHRDIKPGNVLFHYESQAWKLADFGISTSFSEQDPKIYGSIGTLHYMAPEMLTQPHYTAAVDMWAVGVTCYYALSRIYPFDSDSDDVVKELILKGEFSFSSEEFKNVDYEAKDFIRHLIIFPPEKRLTASQALSDNWLYFS